jgi:predicted 3-demethylubiquinone-9 3-methyltransferase (glyoxalase superfamily)
MPTIKTIQPCLWFDSQAEEAAKFYVSVFEGSKITRTTHYTEAGKEVHGRPPGSVMTVAFELDGHKFTALNGGPLFKFSEAVSFEVHCETQAQIDYFWGRLGAGGDSDAQQCGWLKDRYGLLWQIVWDKLDDLFADKDPAKVSRTMNAMLKMKKLDIATLQRAYDGKM